jgi:hydrogenase maturation protease
VILIIGYGNPLRSDDGIGQRMAQVVEAHLPRADVQVIAAYQLMPELVEPVSHAQFVIFIDARVGGTPGLIVQETVEPEAGAGAFTHHLTPATLLGAAYDLYGVCPQARCFTVTGSNFAYGERLSPPVQAAVPLLWVALQQLIAQFPADCREISVGAT